jgi:hypothetical protein
MRVKDENPHDLLFSYKLHSLVFLPVSPLFLVFRGWLVKIQPSVGSLHRLFGSQSHIHTEVRMQME